MSSVKYIEIEEPIFPFGYGWDNMEIARNVVFLRQFWKLFNSTTTETRIKMLVNAANPQRSRIDKALYSFRINQYRRMKVIPEVNPPCILCSQESKVNHHIIPLVVGGLNWSVNMIRLCDECHQKIHHTHDVMKTDGKFKPPTPKTKEIVFPARSWCDFSQVGKLCAWESI